MDTPSVPDRSDPLTALRPRIHAALRSFFDSAVPPLTAMSGQLAPLAGALVDFVLDGGKRLRPAFCYWGHRSAGGADSDELVTAAASLELVQAAALMHDDVIDASDTRRGAPSVHRRFATAHRANQWSGDADSFGVATAILLGDLAWIWADTMLNACGIDVDALHRARAVWDAMRVEVTCGQYLDVVEQSRGGGSVERAMRVARLKSASYTVARPVQLGAALAGAPPDVMSALDRFGVPLGEAFQLRDDLLGVFGDPEQTGKPAGDDLREGKRTVLVALATEAASPLQRDVIERRLGDPGLDDRAVTELRNVFTETHAVERIERLIDERVQAARSALQHDALAPDGVAALLALADAATQRVR